MASKVTARQKIIILTVVVSSVIEIIDATIVNVSLPYMMGNLGATLNEISWVIASYAIANFIMVASASWLSAKLGRKNYFTISILIFTCASFFCGISTNVWELTFFRFLQGTGGGALLATAQAILVETFPKEQLNKANAVFGSGIICGPALGFFVGGAITEYISWHWIFFINIPIGLTATVMSYIFIPEPKEVRKAGKFDWQGWLFLVLGFGSLLVVLENGQEANWFSSTYISVLGVIAVFGIILFVWRELTAKMPLTYLRVFRIPTFAMGMTANLIAAIGFSWAFLLFPIFSQQVVGLNPLQTGILIMPAPIAALTMVFFIGRIKQSIRSLSLMLSFGVILVFLHAIWFASFNQNVSQLEIVWPLLVRGAGLSVLFVPMITITLYDLKGKEIPEGTGLFNMARKLGNALGIALITVFISRRSEFHETRISEFADGTNPVFESVFSLFKTTAEVDNPAKAESIAKLYMAESIQYQGALLTYMDTFIIIGLFFLACLPVFLLFLLKKTDK
ncbi:MFS transporter [Fulvitalea axinellae]|uniref:MFS transporter n=1 Tax=Fulvitalea axinellae TaxID=1182444 RepID=A0AAU9CA96_9BACT|nr:MFS transporter [Fulvitalea axinellae]